MSNVGMSPVGIGLKIEHMENIDNFELNPTPITRPKLIQQAPPQPSLMVFQSRVAPTSFVPYTPETNIFQGYHFLDNTSMRQESPAFPAQLVQLGTTHACVMCPARFTSKKLLTQHRIDVHLARTHKHQKILPKPTILSGVSDVPSKVPIQKLPQKLQEIFICCGKAFKTKKYYISHVRRHAQNYECDKCGKICISKHLLVQHMLRRHLKINKCKVCKRYFATRKNFKKHISKCTEEKDTNLVCHECGTKYKKLRYLKFHINRVHNTKFICEFCGKGFGLLNELMNHERRHTGDRPYACHFCQKAFHSRYAIADHVMTHIMPHNLECDVCGKKFNIRANLTNHRILHFEELKRYECSLCNRKFHFNSSLQKHLASHTQEKPFQCSVCAKLFTRMPSLRTHMMVYHSSRDILEFKKFHCTMCDKKFMAKNQLARHVRTHTGERPYGCDLCHQSFVQMSQLRTHKMLKHKILPYECSKCGERFKIKSDMMAHFIGH